MIARLLSAWPAQPAELAAQHACGTCTNFRISLGHGVLQRELGAGVRSALQEHGPRRGNNVLVVSGVSNRAQHRAAFVLHLLRQQGINAMSCGIPAPTATAIEDACVSARRLGTAAVVSVGGGGTLDAGKAIAAVLANGGSLLDHTVQHAAEDDPWATNTAVDAVRSDMTLAEESLPHFLLPTLLGSGAETNPAAVIVDDSDTALEPQLLLPSTSSPMVALVDHYCNSGQNLGLPAAISATTPASLFSAMARALEELLVLSPLQAEVDGEHAQGNIALRKHLARAILSLVSRRLAPIFVAFHDKQPLADAVAAAALGTAADKYLTSLKPRSDEQLWAADAEAALASAYVGVLGSFSGMSTSQALALATAAGGCDGASSKAAAALLPGTVGAHCDAFGDDDNAHDSAATDLTAVLCDLGLSGPVEQELLAPDELLAENVTGVLEALHVPCFADGVEDAGASGTLSGMAARRLVEQAHTSFDVFPGFAAESSDPGMLLNTEDMVAIVEDS